MTKARLPLDISFLLESVLATTPNEIGVLKNKKLVESEVIRPRGKLKKIGPAK